MERITVVKIGGNVIDSPEATARFVEAFAALEGPKLLVHGGGKLATVWPGSWAFSAPMAAGRACTPPHRAAYVPMGTPAR